MAQIERYILFIDFYHFEANSLNTHDRILRQICDITIFDTGLRVPLRTDTNRQDYLWR